MKEIEYEGRPALVSDDPKEQEKLKEMLARPRYLLTVRHVDENGCNIWVPSCVNVPVGKKIALAPLPFPVNGRTAEKDIYIVEKMPAEPLEVRIEYRRSWPSRDVATEG